MKEYIFRFSLLCLSILFMAGCGRKNIPVVTTPEVKISEEDIRAIEEGVEKEEVTVEDLSIQKVKEIEPLAPYILLSFEKTDCPGFCPVFEIRLFSDGRALYRGTKDVELIGKFESRLTSNQLSMIIEEAERIDFYNMAKQYPLNGKVIQELPTTVTSINQLSKAHSITNRFDSPRNLRSFEQYLIQFFDGLNWQQIAG